MDNELQIGLAALGVAAVASIVGYNKWQERKHRKQAEQAFKSEHRDVLLEPRDGGEAADEEPSVQAWGDQHPAAAVRDAGVRRASPGMPPQVDARVDCIVRLESIEALEASRLWAAQGEQLQGITKPVGWFAFDDRDNLWHELGPNSAGAYHWFCAAMQMVDRRGPIGENDLMHFSGGVQRVADQFLALPADLPSRGETLRNAAELDRFCADVDVQIGVNIISNGAPFPGTKIRALAESHGLTIDDDGAFHARDDEGQTVYTLSNMEPALFATEGMRDLATSGLTLVIDVPRVGNGVQAFDRMMRQAAQMAEALQGVVVDDNRAPLGGESAAVIRSQIAQFQSRMTEGGLPPGGQVAMRLFSA